MAQSREQILAMLESIGRQPNRRLGQHFMIDPNLITRLTAEAGLADHPVILEVGPGTGTLTESLLEAGAEVVAVEIDAFLADLLRSQLLPRFAGRLRLISADVLEGKHQINHEVVAALAEAGSTGRPVRLVANLPYNIASPLMAELIDLTWRGRRLAGGGAEQAGQGGIGPVILDRLVFTVQREVAERLTAEPDNKDYGPLSVLCQGLGDVRPVIGKISPNAFHPKPNVFSAMLRIDLPSDRLAALADLQALHVWLEVGFRHRRKTLAASIRFASADWQVRLTTAAIAVGVDLSRRGETLAVKEYLALAGQT